MNVEERVTYNMCQGAGCHEQCVHKLISKDDHIMRVERALLKGPKADRYSICAKGLASKKLPDLPERLTHPLKRVGERGEGKFEQISWDQAIQEIGEKLRGIIAEYGPRSVLVNSFLCGIPANSTGSLSVALASRFINVLGASKFDNQPVDISTFWPGLVDFGEPFLTTAGNPLYWQHHRPNYILMWGGNPVGWTRAGKVSQVIIDAQQEGTKIVTVGLMYDSTAAKSDEFVRVKAGTDAALALAMANVMIEEDLFDHEFVTNYTVAPLLIRNDNGMFLRKGDVAPEGELVDAEGNDTSQDYVIWDASKGTYFFNPKGNFEWGDNTPDIYAEVEVGGIACKSAFVRLREHVAKWTPESQEELTGVPAETVYHVTRDFVEHSPAGTFTYYGMRYRNSGQAMRAINLVVMLSGNLNKKNGGLINGGTSGGHMTPLDFGIQVPGLDFSSVTSTRVTLSDVYASFDNPDAQQYKAYINCFSNPVLNWPNRNMWAKEFFPRMDLIVVNEIRMTDTCMFADYVLPEASVYERTEVLCSVGDCIVYSEPAVKPRGEAKTSAELWNALAEAAGIGDSFGKTEEEWLRMKLENYMPQLTFDGEMLTFERLKEEKIIPLNVPEDVDNRLVDDMHFGTPTGKLEFYCEGLVDVDGAMGDFVPTPLHDPARRAKHPYQFFPGRSRFFMQGQFSEYPELRELDGLQSTVGLNPKTAREKGIRSGDLVEIFNDHGSSRAYAKLTEYVNPDMVLLWYAYPAKDYITDPPTVLNHPMGIGDTQDAYSRKIQVLMKQFNGEGMPDSLTLYVPDAAESYWDELVDFRKVEEE